MLLNFHAAAAMPFPASAAWAHGLFCDGVTDPKRLALIGDGVLLLGIVSPSILGPFMQAQEIAWWAEPGRRGKALAMLAEYEAWAIGMGAKLISVASLAGLPDTDRIYQARGYAKFETHWLKVT